MGSLRHPLHPSTETASELGRKNIGEGDGQGGESNPLSLLPQRMAEEEQEFLGGEHVHFLLPLQCEVDDWATRHVTRVVEGQARCWKARAAERGQLARHRGGDLHPWDWRPWLGG